MKFRRVQRKNDKTPEARAEEKALREKFQREKPTLEQLIASGEYEGPFPLGVYYGAMALLAQLRPAREAAGLSLAELEGRTGIDKAALSRLENGEAANPTLFTVLRYLAGLGKTLECSLTELPAKLERAETEAVPKTGR